MTRRMFQVLLAVGTAGLISCTATEETPEREAPGVAEPMPADDGEASEPTGTSEPAEPNDIGDAPGTFALPAIDAPAVLLRGCFAPSGNHPDRDAFSFDAAGPTYLALSAAGTGGAFAGLLVETDDVALADDGWVRIAADPGATSVTRRVFLPKAGRYYVVASDSRSIVSGVAMGDGDSCYELSVAQHAVPVATPAATTSFAGKATGEPLFFQYTGDTGAHIAFGLLEYAHPGAVGSIVTMRNGEYVASGTSARMPAHGADDQVILVVDSMFRVMPGTGFAVSIDDTGLIADPGDGSMVTFTQTAGAPAASMFFYAKRGELVNLGFASDGGLYDVSVVRPDGLGTMAKLCQVCSAQSSTWMSAFQTGLHEIRIVSHTAATGESFSVAFDRTHSQAWSVDVGSKRSSDLSRADRAWYRLDVAAGDAIELDIRPTAGDAFDAARVRIYDASQVGQIDSDDPFIASVPLLHSGVAADGAPMTHTFDATRRLLVSVEDAGAHDGDESFEMTLRPAN